MATTPDPLPDDTEALKAALIETRAKLVGAQALIEHLQLVIAKMKREVFGPRSERSQRLLDQLELQLEELAAAAGEDETKTEAAGVQVQGFTRRPATRRNFPADTDGTNRIWLAGGYAPTTPTDSMEIFNCPVSPCGGASPTPTATATATAVATATPTSTRTPTPTPTATASSTSTPPTTPTPTPTARPIPTPRPRPTPAPRP